MLQNDASQTGSTPDARNDLDTLVQCDLGPATGNAITGAGTVSGSAGADIVANAPAMVVAVNGIESEGGSIQVEGMYGTLVIQSDGSYTYTRSANAPDGVSDVFTYTLADATGARDTATLTVDLRCQEDEDDLAQSMITTEDGVVMLPAGVELSDIRVVGRDLIITLPDGSTVTVPGGAVFVPQIVIGDVEVPPSNLAALLVEQEPQPASGTPESSGGNFAVDVPPLDPGVPLGDLLPPTDFGFTPPVFEEVGQIVDEEPEIQIQPDGQPASANAVDEVDEAGLPPRGDEPPGSNQASSSETTTGVILIDSPDGPSVVTVNGVAVTAVGQVIAGEFGTLTITSISESEIGYSYTLADNTSGNNTQDDFSVTVTDNSGDTDTATLTINIIDDVPTAVNDSDSIAAGEFGPATGNVVTDADPGDAGDGDNGADTVGADDADLTDVTGAGETTVNENGDFVVEGEFGILTIAEDGSYSYVRNAGTPGGVTDTFTYTLTDGDGDTDTATLTINIGDLTPETDANPAVLVDDDALEGGNPGGTGDDPDSVNTTGTLAGTGGDGDLTFDLQTSGAPDGFTYVDGPGGSVLVQQGGVTVLTITIDAETGEYTVTQNAPIDHAADGNENNSLFTIDYTVTDADGDSATGELTINVDDDTPEILRADVNPPVLLVDETDLAVNDSGDFSTLFDVSYGADGAGTTEFTLAVPAAGTPSGLTDVATGDPILLFENNGVIEGRVGGADGPVAFTVSVDAETGVVTLDQLRALDHPDATDPDDTVSPDATSIQLTVTATDADGDPVSETVNIGGSLSFDDDGPTVSEVAAGAGVTLDETEAGSPAGFPISASSTTAAVIATSAFGADGAGTIAYGLDLAAGADSGLATAIGDFPITLVQVDANTIQGQYNGANVAFTIDIDPATGELTVTQEVPLEHLVDGSSAAAHDDALDLAGLINATVTVTDGDGDTASGEAEIGGNIVFEDDGPTIDVTAGVDGGVTVQTQDADTIGGATDDSSTADFSGVFDAVFDGGADGAAGTPDLSYSLDVTGFVTGGPGIDSGLNQGNSNIYLYEIGGKIVASTSATLAGVSDANTVFDVSVDGSGVVTLTQYSEITHSAEGPPGATDAPFADQIASIADELITLTASGTVTDNDGDTATDSATVNIGANLRFADDGPDISAVLTGNQLVVDETDGETAPGEVDPAGGNLGTVTVAAANLFTVTAVHASADSPTDLSYDLTLSAPGVASGLLQSANNEPIFLYEIGGVVYGSTATDIGDVALGTNVAFTVSIDADTGAVTLTQFQAVEHTNTASDDELSAALDAGVLNVTVTATDFDGDTDQATVDLGSVIRFEDDGPTATQNQVTGTVDEDGVVEGAADAGVGDGIAGGPGDVAGTATVATGSVTTLFDSGSDAPLTFNLSTNTGGLPSLTSNGVPVTYSVVGNTLTASAGAETVFTFVLNANGSWTFTLFDQLDHETLDGLAGDNTENELTIALGSIIQATDADGDPVTANSNGLVITVDDDTPVARNDTDAIVSGGNTATGNVISGSGTTSGAAGADSTGADAPATITAISGADGTDTTFTAGVLSIGGDHGTLVIDAQGEYTYTRDAGSPGNVQDVFTYTYTDADGDSVTATLTITISDDAPVLTAPPAVQLDDDNAESATGNPGGPGDDNVSGTSGDLSTGANGGDGDLDFFFAASQTAPAGFSYNLVDSSTLQILQGATLIATVELNNETGTYTVTHHNPVDHESLDGLPGDNTENNTPNFEIGLFARDADNDDSPVVDLVINIDDDTPVNNGTTLTPIVVHEDALNTADAVGNSEGGQTATASISVAALQSLVSPGADAPVTIGLNAAIDGAATGLTQNGVSIVWNFVSATEVQGVLSSDPTQVVFTVVRDGAEYDFTLLDNIDHDSDANLATGHGDAFTESLSLDGVFTATDSDGDTIVIDAGASVTIQNDVPIASGTQLTGIVDEDGVVEDAAPGVQAGDGIAGGPDDVVLPVPENVTTGNISTLFSAGADAPLTFSLASSFAALTGQGLTSGGVALSYAVTFNAVTGVYTLTATAGAETVFTFAVDADSGAYTFTLLDQLDHDPVDADGDNVENELTIDLSSIIRATDSDGDTATAGTGGLVITVDDDTPVAINPDPITTGLENEAGQSETADLDVDGQIEDNVGADQPGTVTFANLPADTGLTSGGAEIDYFVTNNGQTLEARTGGADGTLIFTVELNVDPNATDTYTVTIFQPIDNGSGVTFDDLVSTSAGNVNYRGVGADDPATEIDLLLSASDNGADTTVNTDSDSIGSANQSMNPGETVRIDFVTNLEEGTVTPGTPTGFTYGAHVYSNSFLGMIPQVQGNQDQEASFTVYALDTTLGQSGEPDRDPAGAGDGFDDATITEITSVTVIGFDTGEEAAVTVDISGASPGDVVNVAYGISVVVNADGSVTFQGVQEGDQYGFGTGAGEFNAIVVEAHAEFDLGVFSIGVQDSGDPINLLFDLALTDADGDTVVIDDALDITIAPDSTTLAAPLGTSKGGRDVQEPLSDTSSLQSSNDNFDQQLKSVNAANSNTVFLGAIAAAGIGATPAAAHNNFSDFGEFTLRAEPMLQFDALRSATLERGDSSMESAMFGKSAVTVQDSADSISSAAKSAGPQVADTLDGGEGNAQAAAPVDLPQGTDAPAQAAAADIASVAMSVAMPSAEALVAAQNGAVDGKETADVARVLADALAGGSDGPSIDALIDAATGGQSGGSHDLAAGGWNAGVPAWDMGAFSGFTAGHIGFSMDAMTTHPDAAPTTAA